MSREAVPDPASRLQAHSAFSYRCHACGRCCHHKRIYLAPHEVLLLARHLGMSTTAFLAELAGPGPSLRLREEDGACLFLDGTACRVHPVRPLACRLYPLGLHVDPEGVETFSLLIPHPHSAGEYGREGTVNGFLAAQGVGPWRDWSRRYAQLHSRMLEVLARQDSTTLPEGTLPPDAEAALADMSAGDWMDIDAVLERHADRHGAPPPATPEQAIARHLEILHGWLDALLAAQAEAAASESRNRASPSAIDTRGT
ncbi:MAG: YkgJ family cysteine cluster protein [Thermomonas sp.]